MKRWSLLFVFLLAWSPWDAALVHGQSVEALLHATCKVSNPTSTATCFLIHPTADKPTPTEDAILITAAHVFDQAKDNSAVLVARKLAPDETYQRMDLTLVIRDQGQPKWFKHPTADVAAMRVKLPADCALRPLPLAWIAGEARADDDRFMAGANVRLLTYPAQLQANEAGFPIIRGGMVASFPLRPLKQYPTFMVDCTSFGGDSGGPVFVAPTSANPDATPLILGLVSGQNRQTETIRTVYEERVVHHSLGLAMIVQAALIRETIERLPQ